MDDWGGCICALIVLIIIVAVVIYAVMFVAWAFAYSGLTVILAIEFLARGFRAVGIANPVTAWAVLGAVLGAIFGLAHGLSKAGKSSAVPWAWGGGIAVFLLLLVISLNNPLPSVASSTPVIPVSSPCTLPSISEWRGTIRGENAILKITPSDSSDHCTGVVRYEGVVEKLAVTFDNGKIILAGKSFRRSSRNGGFSLDTFSGQFTDDGQQINGTYIDRANNQGAWSMNRYVKPAATAALNSSRGITSETPRSVASEKFKTNQPNTSVPPPQAAHPEAALGFITQARKQLEDGDYDAALKSCDAALRLDPNNTDAARLKEKIQKTVNILNGK